jgi:hypothetical protein
MAVFSIPFPWRPQPIMVDLLCTVPFVLCIGAVPSSIVAGLAAAVLGQGRIRRDGFFSLVVGSSIVGTHWLTADLVTELIN